METELLDRTHIATRTDLEREVFSYIEGFYNPSGGPRPMASSARMSMNAVTPELLGRALQNYFRLGKTTAHKCLLNSSNFTPESLAGPEPSGNRGPWSTAPTFLAPDHVSALARRSEYPCSGQSGCFALEWGMLSPWDSEAAAPRGRSDGRGRFVDDGKAVPDAGARWGPR